MSKLKPYSKDQSLHKAAVRDLVSDYEKKKAKKKKPSLPNTTTIGQRYKKILNDPSKKPKGNKIKYFGSDGKSYTQDAIDNRLRRAYKESRFSQVCQCCGSRPAEAHDHTISQKRCKQLHKTELIWESSNWSDSCNFCHKTYESYKSGKFQEHKNIIDRMLFIKRHDLLGFKQRLEYITDQSILNQLSDATKNQLHSSANNYG